MPRYNLIDMRTREVLMYNVSAANHSDAEQYAAKQYPDRRMVASLYQREEHEQAQTAQEQKRKRTKKR